MRRPKCGEERARLRLDPATGTVSGKDPMACPIGEKGHEESSEGFGLHSWKGTACEPWGTPGSCAAMPQVTEVLMCVLAHIGPGDIAEGEAHLSS